MRYLSAFLKFNNIYYNNSFITKKNNILNTKLYNNSLILNVNNLKKKNIIYSYNFKVFIIKNKTKSILFSYYNELSCYDSNYELLISFYYFYFFFFITKIKKQFFNFCNKEILKSNIYKRTYSSLNLNSNTFVYKYFLKKSLINLNLSYYNIFNYYLKFKFLYLINVNNIKFIYIFIKFRYNRLVFNKKYKYSIISRKKKKGLNLDLFTFDLIGYIKMSKNYFKVGNYNKLHFYKYSFNYVDLQDGFSFSKKKKLNLLKLSKSDNFFLIFKPFFFSLNLSLNLIKNFNEYQNSNVFNFIDFFIFFKFSKPYFFRFFKNFKIFEKSKEINVLNGSKIFNESIIKLPFFRFASSFLNVISSIENKFSVNYIRSQRNFYKNLVFKLFFYKIFYFVKNFFSFFFSFIYYLKHIFFLFYIISSLKILFFLLKPYFILYIVLIDIIFYIFKTLVILFFKYKFMDFFFVFSYIIFSFGALLIPILLIVAYLTLFERKVIGSSQRRLGPNAVGVFGLTQPIADGLKLFSKETIIPSSSNIIIFILTPIAVFFFSLINWLIIPFNYGVVFADIDLGILFFFAISSLSVYGIILAGWSSNSKYAFLGALRSAAQMIAYEVSIGLILIAVLFNVSSLNLSNIVEAQELVWFIIPHFCSFILFFISALAETNRAPFDLPEAESELVSGYNVEYSAMTFALFFLAEYANIILISTVIAIVFFGGWSSWGINFFFFKILFNLFVFIWVRTSLPRYSMIN